MMYGYNICCWWLIRPIKNYKKDPEENTETLVYGIHLIVLKESFPVSTSMTRFRWFSKDVA